MGTLSHFFRFLIRKYYYASVTDSAIFVILSLGSSNRVINTAQTFYENIVKFRSQVKKYPRHKSTRETNQLIIEQFFGSDFCLKEPCHQK